MFDIFFKKLYDHMKIPIIIFTRIIIYNKVKVQIVRKIGKDALERDNDKFENRSD